MPCPGKVIVVYALVVIILLLLIIIITTTVAMIITTCTTIVFTIPVVLQLPRLTTTAVIARIASTSDPSSSVIDGQIVIHLHLCC